MITSVSLLISLLCVTLSLSAPALQVIGLRGAPDDASERCKRSADVFGYYYTEIDLSDFGRTPDEVKEEVKLAKIKQAVENSDSEYVLIIDSHLSVLIGRPSDLIQRAENLKADYIYIAGDAATADEKPKLDSTFNGLFTRTKLLHEAIPRPPLVLSESYVKSYLEGIEKQSASVLMDTSSSFFQQITTDTDLNIRFEHDRGYIQNVRTDTVPVVAVAKNDHESKRKLNGLCNYLTRSWSPETGCQICDEDRIDLEGLQTEDYPVVMLGVFIVRPTPFLEPFFKRLANLDYPKSRIHLTTFCAIPEQQKFVDNFLDTHGSLYRSVEELSSDLYKEQDKAFLHVANMCLEASECENLFYVEGTAQFTWPGTLKHLVSTNRSVVAPLMTRHNTFWSTFWGDIADDGSYKRSNDYFEIVERRKRGLWNVPLVGTTFLLSRWALSEITSDFIEEQFFYLSLTSTTTKRNVFMYVDNRVQFGRLTNPTTFGLVHLHNDLWQLFDNPVDWEEAYIHPDYYKFTNKSITKDDFEQPCQDVFWVPLMSELFCRQLVEEMEHYGKWSDGSNYDARLESGYEAVPTRDIHMRQIDWEEHWLHVLRTYVYPIQLKLWEGYNDKPWARMNFVVRYKPGEQPSLRFHHDAATYTLDMALNRVHVDYEGGGVHFLRYGCKLVETRVGWPLIFPGRLTHLHEGLETTSGIRYIFVTFVNP
ncbi:Procollagen-lysine2-oxoglutarate 5-dioxygenase 1 [Taenia solium]|eukprot:TsM_001231800 transcript=TsM_001231800 gene=TsM_001231800